MTVYTPIAILAFSVLGLAAIITVHLSRMNRRLDQIDQTLKMIMRETVSAEDSLRAADRLIASDVRHLSAEATAHARALDNHADRLLILEEAEQ